ncbi:peptide ABC transporter substrate-binding protein [Mucisphaera sp.]|uniref:peptide ABC transporter substrate-binding protein n=1 Tax=Mucisphaera sp. TaxID=2913024 RepID=UPI003D13F407
MMRGSNQLLACLLGALIAFATGCGSGESSDSAAPEGKQRLVFIANQEHNSRDPQRITWTQDIRLADCLFEPLVVADYVSMQLNPGTAERWEVSEDGLTYTFHIRENARWSNGDPVTSHDFTYAWQRAMLPDFAAGYAQLMFVIRGAADFFDYRSAQIADYIQRDTEGQIVPSAEELWADAQTHFEQTVGIETPDDRTLVVHLAKPTPYFLDLAAFATFMPVHRESVAAETRIVEATGQLTMDTGYWSDPDRLIVNGPYVLEESVFRQRNDLRPNPMYWDAGSVRNSGIRERIITDPSAALLTYQTGEVHYWPRVPTGSRIAADLAAKPDRGDVHAQPMAGTFFLNLNCQPQLWDGRENPLADERVRQALSMAIDRSLIVRNVTQMGEPVASTFIPPGVVAGYNPPAEAGFGFDPQAAAALLAEAGYPNGQGLTGLEILYRTDSGEDGIAQVIRRMWEDHLGLSVRLTGLENRVVVERVVNREFTIARGSWYGDYPDPTTWLDRLRKPVGKSGNNASGWDHPPFDALMNRAALELDPTARLALLRDAEAMMIEAQPILVLFHYVSLNLYDPGRLDGIQNNPWFRERLHLVAVNP